MFRIPGFVGIASWICLCQQQCREDPQYDQKFHSLLRLTAQSETMTYQASDPLSGRGGLTLLRDRDRKSLLAACAVDLKDHSDLRRKRETQEIRIGSGH